ncbi:MAG: glycosyltransferase [Candidatus Pacebacteria bacterium]|nr:glycosyltransferase [Candidatus Paceibacterota bacterium]
MKILQVCCYLYPALTYGGPAKVVYDLSVELAKKHQLTIYTTDVWDAQQRIRANKRLPSTVNLKINYFANLVNSWAFHWRFFTGFGMVRQFIKEHQQFDLVHLHDVFILPQILLAYLAILVNKPYLITPHGVIDPVRMQRRSLVKKIFYYLAWPVLKRAQAVIAVSAQEQRDLQKLGLKNVQLVYNGVPEVKVKKSTKFKAFDQQKILTLLYIGKLHPQKGLKELILALKNFSKNWQLLLAGPDDGALAELQQTVAQQQLQQVHFLGYVNDADKQALFALADLFVYPSYAEGFSISVLEAMQAGLPVLITDGCNFAEVAQAKAGWVIKKDHLITQLKDFFQHWPRSTILARRGQQAARLVNTKYSIQAMSAKMEQLYEQAI